ncbi:hypothetical protein ElyMa_006695000 [Elysia marginata]|uniref:Uncharacterized protein n=1 Tax=Elysia marginata TaxID=1093978 RepID=A0AAV4INX4_9GAST|nr:hypothetical protein ElyMa_006695000 [Elysia marginata]
MRTAQRLWHSIPLDCTVDVDGVAIGDSVDGDESIVTCFLSVIIMIDAVSVGGVGIFCFEITASRCARYELYEESHTIVEGPFSLLRRSRSLLASCQLSL